MAGIMPDHRERPMIAGQQRVPRVLEPHRRSPAVPSLIKFLGLRSRDGVDCPLPV
jgi:hypothetical protein